MPRFALATALGVTTLASTASASAAVILDLSRDGLTGNTSTGEILNVNNNTTTDITSATFDDGLGGTATVTLVVAGEPGTSNRPNLRLNDQGIGIDSGLPNNADTTFALDETPSTALQESFIFSFDTGLTVTQIGLFGFGIDSDDQAKLETLAIAAAGQPQVTVASNDAQVTANQTVADDNGIAVITLDNPIVLGPNETLTLFVVDDGDNTFNGTGRSSVLLQSLTVVVPEPGSMALLVCGIACLGLRRR
ncbi:MAG: PEP-CTERM sorting domain-containing protein [Planctomycetota bacterium]